ncbi:MAG: crossover junction endodeoxyribonuclease RuvC [Gammaproteobacteria bacterium]|nr:crossover junction endodeoxyribonuclease RuvC [Gammaproteobacteria bacterium]NIT40847.1 crossover junction endodeoxyribonuclease RuvC [Gammaproteobacteria bacterium]
MTRILGIDPGSRLTGYGLIEMDKGNARHITHGTIRLSQDEISVKLSTLFNRLVLIIDEHKPDEVSIENIFLHKNADSALKLGQARGCAITACAEKKLPVYEYTANQVKQATVGKGHAAKQQVQHMIKVLLRLDIPPEVDAADALAIAICHGHYREGLDRIPGVSNISRGRMR